MSWLDREKLDELLPADLAVTRCFAEAKTGLLLSGTAGETVLAGLRWMAEFQERDRLEVWRLQQALDWKYNQAHPLYAPAEMIWQISHWGLGYKGSDSYLTSEGWPLGTKCWFVQINCGWRMSICAETPELTVLWAMVVMAVAADLRAIPPKTRPGMYDGLKEQVLKFRSEHGLG